MGRAKKTAAPPPATVQPPPPIVAPPTAPPLDTPPHTAGYNTRRRVKGMTIAPSSANNNGHFDDISDSYEHPIVFPKNLFLTEQAYSLYENKLKGRDVELSILGKVLTHISSRHLAYVGTVSLLSRKIPYGMILTRVFKKLGIDIPRDLNYVPRNTSISLASLSKMGFQVDETGKWSTGKKKDLKEKKMRR
ncbi:hypothetical protein MIMGU_mgv1a014419mg [Erythranthe guttata]|uniref:Uncharacterized protein n=1 Tax=Erythranthe guttata TaxID=4155 RepID=A0A022QUR6_ERYGU|nr:hypothetical protein MIMGU_mgv1a014419mg [Erythranthe guttata]